MNRTLLLAVPVLLLAAGAIYGMMKISNRPASGSLQVVDESAKADAGWMKEYTLTERSGKKFHSKDLAGQVHVVNFFFSKCPTVCRTQTASVKSLAEEYGPKGVKFLSITCDPANDTPAALAVYAKEFNADPDHWLFLTGDLNDLRRVGAEMYYVAVDVGTHSESLVVVDKWGQIRNRFSWKDAKEVAEMKSFMDDLLAETERPDVK